MRLTITLDDDLYAMARAHAVTTKTSISKAVNDLLRNRLKSSASVPDSSGTDPLTGLPVVPCRRPITSEMVYQMENDELTQLFVAEEK